MAEIFQQLPQDLSNEVLHWCTLRALLALASTSKLLRDLCDNPSIWETRFREHWEPAKLSVCRWRYIRLKTAMRFNQIRVDLKFLRLAPHMVLWKYAALHLAEVHFRSETMSNKQPSTSYSKFNVVSRWTRLSETPLLDMMLRYQMRHFPELYPPRVFDYRCHSQPKQGVEFQKLLRWTFMWEQVGLDDQLDDTTYHFWLCIFEAGIHLNGDFKIYISRGFGDTRVQWVPDMPDREWTVTEPLKNIPLVLKLFHEALEAYMPFSAHNRHATKHALHWYSDFEDICTDLDSEPALCEDLNQHIEQQTTIMTNLALRSIQLSADQHDGRLIKWLDGLVLSPPASSSQCVSERHRPSKLNLVAMKRCIRRIINFLSISEILQHQDCVRDMTGTWKWIRGVIDAIESDDSGKTGWRQNLKQQTVLRRKGILITRPTVQRAFPQYWPLYLLFKFYAAIPSVAKLIVLGFGSTDERNLKYMEPVAQLQHLFGKNRVEQLSDILRVYVSRRNVT